MGSKGRHGQLKICGYYGKRLLVRSFKDTSCLRIEVTPKEIKLLLPPGIHYREALQKHGNWIQRKVDVLESSFQLVSEIKLITRTEKSFKRLVRKLLDELAADLDVKVKRVCCRYMKSKWGSWSSNGVLAVNKFLRFLPEELIRYVLLHELLHFYEPFHNDNFYALVSARVKNYEKLDMLLTAYWVYLEKSGIFKRFLHKSQKSLL